MRRAGSLVVCAVIVMGIFSAVDLVFDVVPRASGTVIYVGGTGGGNLSTIQEGIDAAGPGDTVFVYNDGSPYPETVFLTKTIDLVADNPSPTIEGSVYVEAPDCMVTGFYFHDGGVVVYDDNCIVDGNYVVGGTAGIGIHLESSVGHLVENNYVSGTDSGIRSWWGDNSRIKNNQIHDSAYSGIEIEATSIIVENNDIYNSIQFGGIFTYMGSDNITIANNTLYKSDILISASSYIRIIDNTLSYSSLGITDGSFEIDIEGNDLSSNNLDTAVWSDMGSQFNMRNCYISNYQCGFSCTDTTAVLTDCIIDNNPVGIQALGGDLLITNTLVSNSNVGFDLIDSTVYLFKCTNENNSVGIYADKSNLEVSRSSISNSSSFVIHLESDQFPPGTYCMLIDTSFNKSNVNISGPNSTLEVRWYMHVNVTDGFGNPVPDANVWVEDNLNGTFNWTGITGPDGFARWVEVAEYIQNFTSLVRFTPHKVVAWNDTHVGYTHAYMDGSKTVNIVLKEGTVQPIPHKSSWISIPVISSENEIETVLQSIEGQYDAVQWYDSSDSNDPWKHNHIAKPQYMNDLNEINHTMGVWIHLTDSEDTVLVLNGTRPSSPQSISLHKGWNMVGYPSLSDKDRTAALNNLIFDTHVNAVWTYNSGAQKWEEVGDLNYFVLGKGYWIHAKQDCVWEVPL